MLMQSIAKDQTLTLKPASDGRRKQCLYALLFLLAAFLAYQPIWHAGFVWDDDVLLVNNPVMQQADGWWKVWTGINNDYVPATSSTFWLEWRVFGANPLGYHLDNLLLHLMDAILLWRILSCLLVPGAGLAAAIFALHPVNVESVAWVAERKNTLAMLFYLGTLLLYLRFERTGRLRWYWLAAGTFLLAIFSKTAVAPLPLVLLGMAWWQRGRIQWTDLRRSLLFFLVAASGCLLAIEIQHRAGSEIVRNDGFWSRLAGAGAAVWFYLYKAALPLHLMFVYPNPEVDPAKIVCYLPALLLAVGLALCWHYRGRWGKGWLLAMGYFVVMLLPVLGFVNIYFMRYSHVADHWQYFAMIGPISLAAASIKKLAPALVLLLVLGWLTWQQCGIYASPETLWRATIVQNPGCGMAHDNLGVALLGKGKVDEAIAEFDKTLEFEPNSERTHYDLGTALLAKGKVDEAIAQFRRALEIMPDFIIARNNLAVALEQNGDAEGAVLELRNALKTHPENAETFVNLGNLLAKKGQFGDAIEQYRSALKINPAYADAHFNLGLALFRNGNADGAILHYTTALQLRPDDAEAQNYLGMALVAAGRFHEAIASYHRAISLNSHLADAFDNLAVALAHEGKAQEAIQSWQKSLEINPEQPSTLNNLAWLLATTPETALRDATRAVNLAEQASQLGGGANPMILHTLAAAYAAAGRDGPAATTARRALELSRAQKNDDLAATLQKEIERYEADLTLQGHPRTSR